MAQAIEPCLSSARLWAKPQYYQRGEWDHSPLLSEPSNLYEVFSPPWSKHRALFHCLLSSLFPSTCWEQGATLETSDLLGLSRVASVFFTLPHVLLCNPSHPLWIGLLYIAECEIPGYVGKGWEARLVPGCTWLSESPLTIQNRPALPPRLTAHTGH
jgi:hypothetical protein